MSQECRGETDRGQMLLVICTGVVGFQKKNSV